MFGRRRRRKDAEIANRVDQWRAYARDRGLGTARILHVSQAARTGTKAVIVLEGEAAPRDSWFWWHNVSAGQMLIVDCDIGWGAHTQHDGVVYVGSQARDRPGVLQVFPRNEVRRWERHWVNQRDSVHVERNVDFRSRGST